ncbi:MAG: hypothetical protein LM577_08225 [Thermoproteaceae archaeon]|nr:hypothetical protein [Thermoproteaceae archaeon]
MVEVARLRPRCVYANGSKVDGVYVLRLPCEVARYLVIARGEYYVVSFREDLRALLRFLLGLAPGAPVGAGPC